MSGYYKADSLTALKRFWEEKGKTKSFEMEYSMRLEGIKQIVDQVHAHLAGRLVLDVGCGPGIAASFFPSNSKIVGLDFSISMLEGARKHLLHPVQGDAFNLPFRDSSFNAITCLFVASDYSQKAGIFREGYRTLRKDGFLFFSDYSLNDQHWKLKRAIRAAMGQKGGIFLEDEAYLSGEIRRAGFELQGTKRLQFRTSFKPERYLRSEDETNRLKAEDPNLWSDIQRCIRNKDIHREFLLIVAAK